MARTREFDRAQAVRAARAYFWEHGYEAASISGLEEATGLNRSSIYNEFGSKRGLFDAAVESYLAEIVRPRLRPLVADAVSADALAAYLDGLAAAIAVPASPAAANGCLLINAAGAPISRDAEVARVIEGYRRELRDAIGRGVDAARPTDAEPDRRQIADAVTGLVVAALALARPAPDAAGDALATARALAGRG